MAFIPGGDFSRGRSYDWPDTKLIWYPTVLADDTPVTKLTLSPFYMDVYEVTNQRYASFVKATRRKPPYHWSGGAIPKGTEQRPVHNVSWDDGAAFCAGRPAVKRKGRHHGTRNDFADRPRAGAGRRDPGLAA